MSAGQYRFTPAVQRDLSSIRDYRVERWDARRAVTDVFEIRSAIERIAEQPRRGPPVNEIRVGYRRYAIGSHLVFFIANDDDIDVIRILYQRMDPTRHL